MVLLEKKYFVYIADFFVFLELFQTIIRMPQSFFDFFVEKAGRTLILVIPLFRR